MSLGGCAADRAANHQIEPAGGEQLVATRPGGMRLLCQGTADLGGSALRAMERMQCRSRAAHSTPINPGATVQGSPVLKGSTGGTWRLLARLPQTAIPSKWRTSISMPSIILG